jgi:hypothetical protein
LYPLVGEVKVNVYKLVVACSILSAACLSQAQVSLGGFTFNNNQFGDSMTESDGGTFSSTNWLNVNNADPGNPAYLTGANFDTGIANIDSSVNYTISYGTPIMNGSGDDFGVVVARFSTDDFFLSVSVDGTNFSAPTQVFSTSAVDSGVGRTYFYNGGGGNSSELWVHSLNLSDFGVANGDSVQAIRISSNTELDLIRIAGMNDNAVPEPASMVALGLGAVALIRRRTRR